ncbi:MAG: LPS assembly lipoprotein LptE [Gemmatimonadaceae bacterium]|nr:LPS assembly lipoprotein LptE [Gemmatimonadaceae bacterium]
MMARRAMPNARALLLGVLLLSNSGCLYGFAGGGFPPGIKTVAVLPFDNQTPEPALQRELFDALRKGLQDRLNLREAAESRAHAVVRGTIVKYEVDVPIGFSADPRQATSARRRLQLVLDIEIVEQATGKVLWEKKGLTATGEYAERSEAEGRKQAIEKAINDVVEGAQSQW